MVFSYALGLGQLVSINQISILETEDVPFQMTILCKTILVIKTANIVYL